MARYDRTYTDEFVDELKDYFDGRTYETVDELLQVLNSIHGYNNSEVQRYATGDRIRANDDDHTGPFFLDLKETPQGRICVSDIYW